MLRARGANCGKSCGQPEKYKTRSLGASPGPHFQLSMYCIPTNKSSLPQLSYLLRFASFLTEKSIFCINYRVLEYVKLIVPVQRTQQKSTHCKSWWVAGLSNWNIENSVSVIFRIPKVCTVSQLIGMSYIALNSVGLGFNISGNQRCLKGPNRCLIPGDGGEITFVIQKIQVSKFVSKTILASD